MPEPAIQPTGEVLISTPSAPVLIEPVEGGQVEAEAEAPEPEGQAPDDAGAGGNADAPGDAGEDDPAEPGRDADEPSDDDGEKAVKSAAEDDVEYPPVGTLLAGSDVVYPALDDDESHGALRELANVLLDDGIFDAELSAELVEAQRGEAPPPRHEAPLAGGKDDHVVGHEEDDGPGDQGSEDQLADAIARHQHDSDL
jgi:hypothetical protein